MKRMLLVVAAVLVTATAFAQPGAGGRQRQGGMRIPGMRMMDRPLTLSQVPAATMKAVFKLTADQEKKVEAVQSKTWDRLRGLMPRMQPGQRPDPKAFEALRPKFEAAFKKADGEILAILTPAQRKQVPAMLKEMQALRGSGLPMSLAGSLKLTSAQIAKLEAIGKERSAATAKLFQGTQDRMAAMQKMGEIRDNARKKALGVLNAQQKAAVEKWEKEHPRRGFMMGGPGMGRPGGPGMGGPGMGRPAGPGRPGTPGAGNRRR